MQSDNIQTLLSNVDAATGGRRKWSFRPKELQGALIDIYGEKHLGQSDAERKNAADAMALRLAASLINSRCVGPFQ